MLTDGMALPGVYGADSPSMNSAELRTKGYELSVSWRDQFKLAGKPFEYSVGFNLSDYKSVITKYDNNPNKSLTNLTKGIITSAWRSAKSGASRPTGSSRPPKRRRPMPKRST